MGVTSLRKEFAPYGANSFLKDKTLSGFISREANKKSQKLYHTYNLSKFRNDQVYYRYSNSLKVSYCNFLILISLKALNISTIPQEQVQDRNKIKHFSSFLSKVK